MPSKKSLGTTAVVATAICLTSIMLMQLVQPELDSLDVAVSYYMNGELGWVLAIGLVALGIGSLSLAAGLRKLLDRFRGKVGLWLLLVWAIGCIVGGVFPPDEYGQWERQSVPGMIHGIASLLAFLAFAPAAWLLSKPLANQSKSLTRSRALHPLAGLSLLLVLTFLVCLAPAFAGRPPFAIGLVERLLIAVDLGWLAIAGSIVAQWTSGR